MAQWRRTAIGAAQERQLPGSHIRTMAVVNAASATTTRNGQRRQTAIAGDRETGRPGVQHQPGPEGERLHRNQCRQQHDRQQGGDPLHLGPLQQGLRHRQPGQLEQVAARPRRPGCRSTGS